MEELLVSISCDGIVDLQKSFVDRFILSADCVTAEQCDITGVFAVVDQRVAVSAAGCCPFFQCLEDPV